MDEYSKVSPIRFEKTYKNYADLETYLLDQYSYGDEFRDIFKNCGYKYYIIRFYTDIE
eukprot:jgi/Orpsp1_1/1180758/evm.model.c7180000074567.1